jgi:hypothetical protein
MNRQFTRLIVRLGLAMGVVIPTSAPVRAVATSSRPSPLSLGFIRISTNENGSVDVKNGQLQPENYGQEPIRLTTITQPENKKK